MILPPDGKEADVYGQNGYDTYEQTPPTLPVKDGQRAVGITPAPTATAANGRKSIVQKTPTILNKRTSWFKRQFSKMKHWS
jgi:hypothetical protein